MKYFVKNATLFLFTCFLGTPLFAAKPWSSQQMQVWYPYCKMHAEQQITSIADASAAAFCGGLIYGQVEAMWPMCSSNPALGVDFSATQASSSTLALILVKFYEENAAGLSTADLRMVAWMALLKAYPCR